VFTFGQARFAWLAKLAAPSVYAFDRPVLCRALCFHGPRLTMSDFIAALAAPYGFTCIIITFPKASPKRRGSRINPQRWHQA
jgi:hypothetical protein